MSRQPSARRSAARASIAAGVMTKPSTDHDDPAALQTVRSLVLPSMRKTPLAASFGATLLLHSEALKKTFFSSSSIKLSSKTCSMAASVIECRERAP